MSLVLMLHSLSAVSHSAIACFVCLKETNVAQCTYKTVNVNFMVSSVK